MHTCICAYLKLLTVTAVKQHLTQNTTGSKVNLLISCPDFYCSLPRSEIAATAWSRRCSRTFHCSQWFRKWRHFLQSTYRNSNDAITRLPSECDMVTDYRCHLVVVNLRWMRQLTQRPRLTSTVDTCQGRIAYYTQCLHRSFVEHKRYS
jgi:hypothetical protein